MLSYSKSPGFLGGFDFLFEKTLYRAYSEDFLPIQKNFFFTNGEKYVKIFNIIIFEKI
jgi:hypothetical protein